MLLLEECHKLDLMKVCCFVDTYILQEIPIIQVNNRSKDTMIDMLDRLKITLLEFLMETGDCTAEFMDTVIYAKSLSFKIVDRFVVGRKAQTSLDRYFTWLTENGLMENGLLRDSL